MGHQRLGTIPTSKKWAAVVDEVTGGSGQGVDAGRFVSDVARKTLEAAEAGLQRAIDDPGLQFTFYVLTQIVLAAREEDWRHRLRDVGIYLADHSTLFDFTSEVQRAIDKYLDMAGGATDISEIAQMAAGEALTIQAGPQTVSLFGSGEAELREAIYSLSTKAGFSQLGQRFFGCFMTRFLNFYLSRITPGQVLDIGQFNESLQTHCHQSAKIVQQFCGEWYSKTEFQHGINLENTSAFMAVALKKLEKELAKQREEA